MALTLHRHGVPVRIIDRAAARTDKSKALVLWPRTLELLDIEGCVDQFVQAGIRGSGARIRAHRGELAHVPFDGLDSPFAFPLLIPQSETERILEQVLADRGVTVERETTLEGFKETGDGVQLTIRQMSGPQESADTSWLLACDGAHSTVRHALGVEFSGNTLDSDFVLADVHVDGALPHDELSMFFSRDGLLAVFPIIGGRFRLVAEVTRGGEPGHSPTLSEVQDLLDRRAAIPLRAHDLVWTSNFQINERKVEHYRHGRVFLAGDAAHVHSPAGGQGMNTGMQDAFNVSWRLAMVSRGAAHSALLDGYSVERSAVGDIVLRNAAAMTRMSGVRNGALQRLRNAAVRTAGKRATFRRRMAEQLSELDIAYPKGPLSIRNPDQAPSPSPGDRVRDLNVTLDDGTCATLHEALGDGRFLLLSVGCDAVDIRPDLKGLARAAKGESGGGLCAGFVYLIRPDAYLAMSSRSDRSDRLSAALAALQPPPG